MAVKKKRTRIISAAALGVILILAGVLISGVFDSTHAHVRVVNHADDDFKAVWMDCYATGDTDGHFIARVGKSGRLINFQNAHASIPYGTKIDLNPQFRKGIALGNTITVRFFVDGVEMSNTPLEIPYTRGKRPILVLTGSKKSGYGLAYTGKSVNWLIGA